MPLDESVRGTIKELGTALNEAISASAKVHELLDRLREEGYEPYLCLDAKVALDRRGRRSQAALPSIRRGGRVSHRGDADDANEAGEAAAATFRIDRKDLVILQSLGIDPTRPVRARRRPEAAVAVRSTVARKH